MHCLIVKYDFTLDSCEALDPVQLDKSSSEGQETTSLDSTDDLVTVSYDLFLALICCSCLLRD